MFEISEYTIKEMVNIKNTCEYLECVDCNYYNEDIAKNGCACKLNYPFNWDIEKEVENYDSICI